MASFNKYNQFVQDLAYGVHNFNVSGGHVLKVMLSNTQPLNTHTVRANSAEISAGAGYTSGGNVCTISASAQTSGTYKLTISPDPIFTASGGSIGPFRFVIFYNDTPTTPAVDPLIGWWDYGSSISLNDTETFTVDMDQVNGVLQIV